MWVESVSCDLIANIAGIQRSSVFKIWNKLRSLGGLNLYLNKFNKIGEGNAIIEINESKFGRRKYNKGYRVEGVWVVCVVDRNTKRIVPRHIEKKDTLILTTFCKKYIKRNNYL